MKEGGGLRDKGTKGQRRKRRRLLKGGFGVLIGVKYESQCDL